MIVRYQATVDPDATPAQVLPNTIEVDYNGTPGDPTVRPKDDDDTANLVVDSVSVSGFVFHEQRPGPSLPIPGTTVILIGLDVGGQPVLRTTTTNAAGFYLFPNLTPGNYTIIESQPAGFISSRKEPGTPYGEPSPAENRLNVVIPAGSVDAGLNFNFFEVQPSSLAGFVYRDIANNNVRDPLDPGIGGVTITLIGVDWNGTPVVRTTQTGLLGAYRFADLLPGNYSIIERHPAGFLDNAETVGSVGVVRSANDQFTLTGLGQAQNGIDYNFGELVPASISGFVYVDVNNNGRKNPGEAGIAGVLVRLIGTDDLGAAVQVDVRTDAQGAFRFLGLRPGTYMLREIQPAGYLDGKDTFGNLGGTTTNDRIAEIVLGPNEAGVDYLFGERLPPPPPVPPRPPSKRDFIV